MRALIVEDDADIARDISSALKHSGFIVDQSGDGEDGWFKASTENYAVIVLDVGLPQLDGITVLKNIRRENITTPVLVLTARGNWTERVEGIEAGADDYLGKPFHMEEVIARVKALVRRGAGIASPVLTKGALQLDTRSSLANLNGITLDLTPLEYRLVMHLLLHKGKVVSHGELIDVLYGSGGEPNSNAIEALVRRLRKKIGADVITTQRGFGYVISAD
jgi:two-component system, OmpR family, response regulator